MKGVIMTTVTYSYTKDKNKFISDHFQVKEFASFDGDTLYSDTVLIDNDLIKMLERLFSLLNCTAIKVTSGYRTYKHDKLVGGNGYGQHTLGKAADVICYGSDGIINAKIVCCAAADLGFGGVANISSAYRAVHLDVRSGNRYMGDEIKGTQSIWRLNSQWTDFYKYFGLSQKDIEQYTGQSNKIMYCCCCDGIWSPMTKENTVCGTSENPIHLLAIRSDYCTIRYRVHTINGNWLPWVTGCSISNSSKYAGVHGRCIDKIQISAQSSIYKISYRASASGKNFLPWVTEYNNVNSDGYAGIAGKPIDRIQIKLTRI